MTAKIEKREHLRGELYLIASGILFGMLPSFATIIYRHGGNAYLLLLLRFSIGSLVFFSVLAVTRRGMKINPAEFRSILLLSLPEAGMAILLFSSYKFISSGLATTLHFCYPVVVIVLEAILFKKRTTRIGAICCTLCVVGILLFYEPDGRVNLGGMLLALVSGVVYASYIVILTRSRIRNMEPLKLAAWLSAMVATEIAILMPFVGGYHFSMDTTGWTMSFVLAAFIASTALLTFQMGAARCDAQESALLSTTEPVTSVMIGVIFLHEALTFKSVTGSICVLLSIVLQILEDDEVRAKARHALMRPFQRN